MRKKNNNNANMDLIMARVYGLQRINKSLGSTINFMRKALESDKNPISATEESTFREGEDKVEIESARYAMDMVGR